MPKTVKNPKNNKSRSRGAPIQVAESIGSGSAKIKKENKRYRTINQEKSQFTSRQEN